MARSMVVNIRRKAAKDHFARLYEETSGDGRKF